MPPGDVTNTGAIIIDERSDMLTGRLLVTAEQALAAEAKGWEIVGEQGDRVMISKGDATGPAVRL